MKVGIVGSGSITEDDYDKMYGNVPIGTSLVISGGSLGADQLAKRYAAEQNIKIEVFLTEYKEFGKSAPIVRNQRIVESSDYIIALWDGISKGTADVIVSCIKKNKPIKVLLIKK